MFESRVFVRDSGRSAATAIQSARWLACSLTALVLTAGGWPTAAKADIITFSDTTETVSMSQSGSSLSQISSFPCPTTGVILSLETCFQTYQKAGGASLVAVVTPSGESFAPGNGLAVEIFDQDGITPSDILLLSVLPDNQVQLEFDSDIDGSNLSIEKDIVLLTLQGVQFLPSLTETGGVQDGFTLVWTQGSNDLVRFSSDIDPVPEPSSIVLLGGLLLGFSYLLRKRV